MNIGEAIRQIRKKDGIRQNNFAFEIGITQSYLSQIEKGHKKPSIEVLEKISSVMRIPLPVIVWTGLTIEDIHEDKKEIFALLKPSIDGLINSIFES